MPREARHAAEAPGSARPRRRIGLENLAGAATATTCVAVFLAPFVTYRVSEEVMFTASDMFFVLSLFLLLVSGRFSPTPLDRATPAWFFAFALLMTGILVSSLLRGDPLRALSIILQYCFAYIVLLFIMVRVDECLINKFVKVFLSSMFVINFVGIVVFYTIGYQEGSDMVTGRRRLASFFGEANGLAAMNALTLAPLFYLWFSGRLHTLLALPMLAALATALVLSGSFGGLVAACLSVVVFVGNVMNRRVFWRLCAVAVAGAVFFHFGGGDLLPEAFRSRVLAPLTSGDITQAGTFDSRLLLMLEALDVIANHHVNLIGLGVDQFRIISVQGAPVHNIYLLLWVEGGVLALTGWMLFSLIAVLLGLGARRGGVDRYAGAMAMATVAVFLFVATANAHMYARFWVVPLLLSLGVVMSALRRDPVPAAPPEVVRPRAPRGAAATAAAACLLGLLVAPAARAETPSAEDARATMRRAAEFMRERVGGEGGYGWKYSADLTRRRGEDRMSPTQGWVQPPGIPAVGTAYLDAYQASGDPYYLDAARETADLLVRTQLRSGGWYYMIDLDPDEGRAWCYRTAPDAGDCKDRDEAQDNKLRNASSLDDDTTQSALAFLIRLDRLSPEPDPALHDAVAYGLRKLMGKQYPNGAWPVRLDRRTDEAPPPAGRRAEFPAEWSHTRVRIGDTLFYTTNDHLMRNAIRLFLLAYRSYGDEAYLATARRGAGFVLAAQMPDPQPGWAQHYDAAMHPIWGRKFEPPAIATKETAGLLDVLVDLYLFDGGRRWLDAAGRAAAWLERSRLPEGVWARFYEMRANTPLYMTSDYELTYDDDDTPTHYGFKGRWEIPAALARYRAVAAAGRERALATLDPTSSPASRDAALAALAPEVVESIVMLDDAGRWIEDDAILSATFVGRMRTLAAYVMIDEGRAPSVGDPMLELSDAMPRRAERR